MKILITGGCGFVGSNIAIFLKKKKLNYNVDSLDNLSRKSSKINLERIKKFKIRNFKFDISDYKKIQKLKKYDLIIDCCAEAAVEASKKDAKNVFNTNLVGTFNLLEKIKNDKSKIIFLSTSRVYSISEIKNKFDKCSQLKKYFSINESFNTKSPISLYGFTKLSSENLIMEYSYLYKIKYIINRFGVISGPWQFGRQDQGFISLWLWKFINKKKLNYIGFGGKGNQSRDILHIDDLNELIFEQVSKINKINNKIFNVGGGIKNKISLKELSELCKKITKNNIKIGSIKKTSNYDIPCYISNNAKVYKFYNWRVKKNLRTIVSDTFKILYNNKKTFMKYE